MRLAPISWLVACLMFAASSFAGDPQRILFIGNSYTGVNKLPDVFLELVKDSGRPAPVVKSSTPGGRTLKQHLAIAGSIKLIEEGGWDVVVLQGQSQEPALAETDEANRTTRYAYDTLGRLIAVFLPTAFMGGVPGLFFKQFGWTAVLAILASLLVARSRLGPSRRAR
mgnify:CR=1 FL=1